MKGYLLLTSGVLAAVLGLYVLAVVLEIPVLTDPVPLMRRSGVLAAGIGGGLLSLDVVIPVPSSLVMIAHGALFGVWAGAGLSLLGGVPTTSVPRAKPHSTSASQPPNQNCTGHGASAPAASDSHPSGSSAPLTACVTAAMGGIRGLGRSLQHLPPRARSLFLIAPPHPR